MSTSTSETNDGDQQPSDVVNSEAVVEDPELQKKKVEANISTAAAAALAAAAVKAKVCQVFNI